MHLAASFDALPLELVPTRDATLTAIDTASVDVDVGADALDDGEPGSVVRCELAPLLDGLGSGDEVEDT